MGLIFECMQVCLAAGCSLRIQLQSTGSCPLRDRLGGHLGIKIDSGEQAGEALRPILPISPAGALLRYILIELKFKGTQALWINTCEQFATGFS